MLWDVFQSFHILHALYLIACAVGFYLFWARTRFWFPTYVHVIAVVSLALSIWMMANVPDAAPTSKRGPLVQILLTLALPAMVYFFFVFYGGQRAAYENRFVPITCPHCRETVAVNRGESGKRNDGTNWVNHCPKCGHKIGL